MLRYETGKICFCFIRHFYYALTNVASIQFVRDLPCRQTDTFQIINGISNFKYMIRLLLEIFE
jgi:hypothetical protein